MFFRVKPGGSIGEGPCRDLVSIHSLLQLQVLECRASSNLQEIDTVVAKAFKLEFDATKCASLPSQAVQACCQGSHTPVNPHRQRLLVAAHKETKVLPKEHAKPKGKSKVKAKKAAKQKTTKNSAKKPHSETIYSVVKKKFLSELLGHCLKLLV